MKTTLVLNEFHQHDTPLHSQLICSLTLMGFVPAEMRGTKVYLALDWMKCSCIDSNREDKQRGVQYLSQLSEVSMTVVYTYLASDNARNRRRAKRAAERELKNTVTGCTDRVLKAVTQTPDWRCKPSDEPEFINMENPQHRKVLNEAGRQINARQKVRGKSIPLI